jgi:hypothetical protein
VSLQALGTRTVNQRISPLSHWPTHWHDKPSEPTRYLERLPEHRCSELPSMRVQDGEPLEHANIYDPGWGWVVYFSAGFGHLGEEDWLTRVHVGHQEQVRPVEVDLPPGECGGGDGSDRCCRRAYRAVLIDLEGGCPGCWDR